MRSRCLLVIPLACVCGPLAAGDLAAPTLAKFIRVLLAGTATKGVACGDKELGGELANLGVATDPEAKVVWTDTEKDLARLARQGKLIICGTKALLAEGAAVALVAEGGHPAIYVNMKSLAASGLTLPDSIMKIVKVAQ